MSYTKGQFVEMAFEEIGLAAYAFDLQPEQLNAALHRLDGMMATWNAQGIRIGYPLPSNPDDSSLQTETEVPDSANEAIYQNLALRIAPAVGKTVSIETKVSAKKAYDTLLGRAVAPVEMQLPGTMPSGAGNRWNNIDRPFLAPPREPLLSGDDGPIDFN